MRFSKSFILSDSIENQKGEESGEEEVFHDYGTHKNDIEGKQASKELRIYKVYLKRYFAKYLHISPVAKINNRGVDYALKGNFRGAEVLFKESINEDSNFVPAYNNLGIIFELFGYREKAFKMYSRACLLEPENKYFRRIFLYFEECR